MRKNEDRELKWFGQETLIKAQEKGPLSEKPTPMPLKKIRKLSRAEESTR